MNIDDLQIEAIARELYIRLAKIDSQTAELRQIANNCFDAATAFMKARNDWAMKNVVPFSPPVSSSSPVVKAIVAASENELRQRQETQRQKTEPLTLPKPAKTTPVDDNVWPLADDGTPIKVEDSDLVYARQQLPYLMVEAAGKGPDAEALACARAKAQMQKRGMWPG